MKLIELIVELGNHLLDVLSLLFSVESLNDNFLNIALTITLYDVSIRSKNKLSFDLASNRLLKQYLIDCSISINLQ